MSFFVLLGWQLPRISPQGFKLERSGDVNMWVMFLPVALAGYIQAVMLWMGTGHSMEVSRAIIGGVCVLFILMGNVMGKVRRNFFIGIRTPWTLADEGVWNATHRLAGKTFFWGGMFGLICAALGGTVFRAIALVALVASGIIPVVYSLILSKRLEKQAGTGNANSMK